jgi:predicted Na+-dependent transporter
VLSLLSLLLAVLFFAFGLALSTPDILRNIQRL